MGAKTPIRNAPVATHFISRARRFFTARRMTSATNPPTAGPTKMRQ